MKRFYLSFALTMLSFASAFGVTFHRSFRNGYPSGAQGGTVRAQPQPAVLKAPKATGGNVRVVTNRVVLTKEQAEKLSKSKKGLKGIERAGQERHGR